MLLLGSNATEMRLRPELCHGPHWGSLQNSQTSSLSDFITRGAKGKAEEGRGWAKGCRRRKGEVASGEEGKVGGKRDVR